MVINKKDLQFEMPLMMFPEDVSSLTTENVDALITSIENCALFYYNALAVFQSAHQLLKIAKSTENQQAIVAALNLIEQLNRDTKSKASLSVVPAYLKNTDIN